MSLTLSALFRVFEATGVPHDGPTNDTIHSEGFADIVTQSNVHHQTGAIDESTITKNKGQQAHIGVNVKSTSDFFFGLVTGFQKRFVFLSKSSGRTQHKKQGRHSSGFHPLRHLQHLFHPCLNRKA